MRTFLKANPMLGESLPLWLCAFLLSFAAAALLPISFTSPNDICPLQNIAAEQLEQQIQPNSMGSSEKLNSAVIQSHNIFIVRNSSRQKSSQNDLIRQIFAAINIAIGEQYAAALTVMPAEDYPKTYQSHVILQALPVRAGPRFC